jgi:hypothetical protein
MASAADPPLAGIRVLDLTQVVAGPYCTMMLADMGAEVVKLERAGHGDDLRRTVPYQGREGHHDYYNALNRSKKSIALDLKDGASATLRASSQCARMSWWRTLRPARSDGWVCVDDVRSLNPGLSLLRSPDSARPGLIATGSRSIPLSRRCRGP